MPTKKAENNTKPKLKNKKRPPWTSKDFNNNKNSKETWKPLPSFLMKWKATKNLNKKKTFKFDIVKYISSFKYMYFWIRKHKTKNIFDCPKYTLIDF